MLECLAKYSVKTMPYAILPKYAPSGHKKVFKVFMRELVTHYSAVLILKVGSSLVYFVKWR